MTESCSEREISINRHATLSAITQSTVDNMMKEETKNPKLITLHKLVVGLDLMVSQLLDFPEMKETAFEDK